MKILLAITTLGAGGAEKMVAVLASEYIRRGHSVTVLALTAPPENPVIPEMIREAGAQVHFLNLTKTSLSLLPAIRRAVRREQPDIIHTHLIHPNLLFRLACAGLHIPLVNTIHISERRTGKKFFFLLDRLTFHLADAVTAVSCASARFHEKICGLPEQSIRTIYNGVDPVVPPSAERAREIRALYNFPAYSKILGSIGRLDWQKGYDLLFERADALAKTVPPGETYLLIVFGEGPEEQKLRQLAAAHSSSALQIVLGGFQKDAASLISLFDVFLMPSRYEGYGLALAEAMTLGVSIVCSDADSLPELCRLYHGFSRTVSMESDKSGECLADAVREALTHTRTEGGVLQTRSGMAEEYLTLYQSLICSRNS